MLKPSSLGHSFLTPLIRWGSSGRGNIKKMKVPPRPSVSSLVQERSECVMNEIKARDPEKEAFLSIVNHVQHNLHPIFQENIGYLELFKRMVEPERIIQFRVPWTDDKMNIQINRGFRVQSNSALGPYKGGTRFHPSANLSLIMALGFEQIMKNSLTGLPLGAGKGGSDFDPHGKSSGEVMRFCQAYMTELFRHIGQFTDVPAGDIGVGEREVGYLYGQYTKLSGMTDGSLTGKGVSYGGSLCRTQATGYGVVYFALEMLKNFARNDLTDKLCTISGSGNVALYAAEKLIEMDAKPITLSDSSGFIWEPNGFTRKQLEIIMEIKMVKRGRVSDYIKYSPTAEFFGNKRPWNIPCDLAFPCATQNEINLEDTRDLINNGCVGVIEGANMPVEPNAAAHLRENGVLIAPAKAANAGGVAVSGLEMSQNRSLSVWTHEDVEANLEKIMRNIHDTAASTAEQYNCPGDLVLGASIAGFKRVADSMNSLGLT